MGANPEQQKIYDAAMDWYFNSNEQVFEFSGGPGRGKTWLLNLIVSGFQLSQTEYAPMTFTGAAAINMRRKGMINAKTAHSWCYMPKEVPLIRDGKIVYNYKFNRPVMVKKFVPVDLDPSIKLCIVDEGSSVPKSVANDIKRQGRKILVTGDIDQFGPVGEPRGFLFDPNVMRLKTNMRQLGAFNGIEYLSQRALQGLPLHCGWYNNAVVIPRSRFLKNMDLYMANMDVIICNRNATRDTFTSYCRNKLGFGNSKLPHYGEPLIAKENCWDTDIDGISLVNGLRGTVVNAPDVSGVNWVDKTYKLDFLPNNMNTPFLGIDADYNYLNLDHQCRKEYKDYDSRYKKGIMFEYGYAISSYSSQGSEFDNVLYIQEPLGGRLNPTADYVSITRAKKFLVVVLDDG